MKEAFGWMELLPDHFYEMGYREFFLKREGFNDRLIYEQGIIKRSTMIIASAMVGGKNVNHEKLWPMPGDKKTSQKMVMYKGTPITEGQYRNIMNRKKKKNG